MTTMAYRHKPRQFAAWKAVLLVSSLALSACSGNAEPGPATGQSLENTGSGSTDSPTESSANNADQADDQV